MNSKSPSDEPVKSELEPVSRVLGECLKSLSQEEVQIQLKLVKKIKGSYRLDLGSLHLALEVSKKGGCEIMYPLLYRLVGKETTMISIIQCLLIYGMIVAGDPLDATGHYGVACVGPPDDKAAVNGASWIPSSARNDGVPRIQRFSIALTTLIYTNKY